MGKINKKKIDYLLNENLKLYSVDLTYTVPVLARNEKEARMIVRNCAKYIPEEKEPSVFPSEMLTRDFDNFIPFACDGELDDKNLGDLTSGEIFDILQEEKGKRQKK
jgi:hypothetical protein